MLKNLLLVALRNFKRDKGYSLLNILGLTIGITFSMFLIFYIKDELNDACPRPYCTSGIIGLMDVYKY